MLKSNLNLPKNSDIDIEDLQSTLTEASNISEELREKLSKIKINILGNEHPDVITAVREIFGDSYVSSSGNTIITYDMYCSILNLLRTLGNKKAEEVFNG